MFKSNHSGIETREVITDLAKVNSLNRITVGLKRPKMRGMNINAKV